ncbi:MAG: SGNH/GDSL hydrolase family protein [Rubrivivax sp.]
MSLALKLALSPLLAVQALRTRARTLRLPEAAGEREGEVGSGPPLRLLVAGDSSAAGVGVAHQRDALAAPLAVELARQTRRAVQWRLVAASGLSTAGLLARLREAGWPPADLVMVVTGVNDVVEQVPSGRAVAAREALANALRNAAGARHVAFAPVPPIHRFPALPQPLRAVLGRDAQRHNHALARWAHARSDVSVVSMTMPLHAGVMAEDGFHPGGPVYAYCARAMAAHLGQWGGEGP